MDFDRELSSIIERWIHRYFTQEDLNRMALEFTEQKFKENAIFGKMTLLHFYMFGGEDDAIFEAAAAMELMILALDIFDDVQDADHEAMKWSQVDAAFAINVAIGLTIIAQSGLREASVRIGIHSIASEWLDRHVLRAVNGQMSDLLNQITTEEEYMRMVEAKSAALFECACTLGVVLAVGVPNETVSAYARELGMAAQIKNDMRDALNWEQKNDFLHRKRTLPTLFLLETLDEECRWLVDYFNGEGKMEDILQKKEEIEHLLDSSGALLYASARMRTHYYRFLELLEYVQGDHIWKQKIRSCLG